MADVPIQGIEFEVKGNAEEAASGLNKLANTLKNLKSAIRDTSGLSSLSKTLNNVSNAAGRFVKSGIHKMLENAIAPAKNFANGISNLTRSFKRILFYRVIRTLIKEIGDAFKTGVNNIYQWSKALGGDFATRMDNATSLMTYFKNSIGAAVAPLLNTLVPALETVVNAVVNVINALNQLFAILGGASSWTRAIKTQEEFAEATGGAAKELKNFTLGFDELNVINDSYGGGGGGLSNIADMFEEVAIEKNKWTDFAKQLRDRINASDWYGAGSLLADKFNTIIDRFNSIEWGRKLGEKIQAGISAALGFMRTFSFEDIGQKVADGLTGVLEKINFKDIGALFVRKTTAITDFLLGFIENVNWKIVGKSIGDFFIGAFNEGAAWLKEKDWEDIGKKLYQGAKALWNGIDFDELARSFFNFLGSALSAAVNLISGVISGIIDDIKGYFRKYIKDENEDGKFGGGEIIGGLLAGIKDAILNIDKWIDKNVIQPIVNSFLYGFGIGGNKSSKSKLWGYAIGEGLKRGLVASNPVLTFINIVADIINTVKELFGIHSPSTVFTEIGENVTKGLLNGILKPLTDIYNWIKTNITDPFINGVKTLLGISGKGESTEFQSIGKSIIDGLLSGLKNAWSSITSWISDSVSTIKNAFNFSISTPTVRGTMISAIGNSNYAWNFASGGIVEAGQLFVAREAGPELVGTIGNRTAVANNDQIVSSVASGVAEANAEQNRLLEEQNALLRAILAKTGVSIDGKTIKTAYDKATRDAGAGIMAGGVFA